MSPSLPLYPISPAHAVAAPANPWLRERHHFFVRNLVQGFVRAKGRFDRLYQVFRTDGALAFAELAAWVGREGRKGPLWVLKDLGHQLWRQPGAEADSPASLLDWLLGSIFHEAMKLKENLYMVEVYGPKMDALVASAAGLLSPVECRELLHRTGLELDQQMDLLGRLFGRASYLLRALLPSLADNPLVIRFLLENREAVEALWGESLTAILADLFPAGIEQAYLIAADSYRRGHWYEEALGWYRGALAAAPECEEARRRLFELGSLVQPAIPAP
ncbi:MAG: hypothetical protein AB1634_05390 [Thermodesulfobacteriota bacterium]